MDYLVIRTLEEVHRVHISEIAVLMLESTAIFLTAYAVCPKSSIAFLIGIFVS